MQITERKDVCHMKTCSSLLAVKEIKASEANFRFSGTQRLDPKLSKLIWLEQNRHCW